MKLVGERYDLAFYEDGAFAMACKRALVSSMTLHNPSVKNTIKLMPDLGLLMAARYQPRCTEDEVTWNTVEEQGKYAVCAAAFVTYSDTFGENPDGTYGLCFDVDLRSSMVKAPADFPTEAEVAAWRAFFQLPLRQYRD